MTEMVTSGSMSGERKRSDGLLGEGDHERRRLRQAPPVLHATALLLDSTSNQTMVDLDAVGDSDRTSRSRTAADVIGRREPEAQSAGVSQSSADSRRPGAPPDASARGADRALVRAPLRHGRHAPHPSARAREHPEAAADSCRWLQPRAPGPPDPRGWYAARAAGRLGGRSCDVRRAPWRASMAPRRDSPMAAVYRGHMRPTLTGCVLCQFVSGSHLNPGLLVPKPCALCATRKRSSERRARRPACVRP